MAMAMPLIGIRRGADQAADARRDRDEQETEDHHEDGGEQIRAEAGLARRGSAGR